MTWRVGLLIPSWNSVIEVDFYRSLPRDATLHTSRMYAPDATVASHERMLDRFLVPAAEALASVRPHLVVFGCTSTALLRGDEYDSDVCDRIRETTGAVVLSVSAAVRQALQDTRASRVAVVTPYADAINQRIKAGLESAGIEVSALYGMGLTGHEVGLVTPDAIHAFVQRCIGARVPGEALFLSGADYQALGTLSLLRIAYDVPMVATNLAALQAVKRMLDGLREKKLARGARGLATA